MSNSIPPLFGLLQVVLVLLASKRGQTLRTQIEAKLQNTPDSQLRSKPNSIVLTSQIRSINFKGSKHAPVGSLITPDIILETKDGKKKKYGIQGPDFEKACAQIRQMYPQLCKSV